jgi:hypothetical protein
MDYKTPILINTIYKLMMKLKNYLTKIMVTFIEFKHKIATF